MTEERLKEIEARYEERSAALLADKWFWPEEDRLAWDSLAFVPDLVAALREAQAKAILAGRLAHRAHNALAEFLYGSMTANLRKAMNDLDKALDAYDAVPTPPQEAI